MVCALVQAQASTGRLSVQPRTPLGHSRRSRVITSGDSADDDKKNKGGNNNNTNNTVARPNTVSPGVHINYGVEWERNSMHPRCTACGRKFSFVVRRHHCRMCGTVVCADCSKARVAMVSVHWLLFLSFFFFSSGAQTVFIRQHFQWYFLCCFIMFEGNCRGKAAGSRQKERESADGGDVVGRSQVGS